MNDPQSDQSNQALAGQLRLHEANWRQITSDFYILDAINGYKLEFKPECFPPRQNKPIYPYARSADEREAIQKELDKLWAKDVIEKTVHEEVEFISNIFTRPKKSGGIRIILNLSELNEYMQYQHFKMDNFQTAAQLITPNCYMASIDLRDAYYSVPIHESSRRFLKFKWNGELWQFKVLPNGLSTAPRLFTKLMKPVFATLRMQGHMVLGYIDDTIIIGNSLTETERAIAATKSILEELGFTVHPQKSVLKPTREIAYLGFIINSVDMVISLPPDKVDDVLQACTDLIGKQNPSIRQVAKVIGKIIATFPAVEYGPLHYRSMEECKIRALKANKGHFDRPMMLSDEAIQELHWWLTNLKSSKCPVARQRASVEIRTDASKQGWGATTIAQNAGGRWNRTEMEKGELFGINYLELLAAALGLQSLCADQKNVHIQLKMDNTTAVAYINHMGGTKSPPCNSLAKSIWQWCNCRNIWITAVHLPGIDNVEADSLSRNFNDRTEWMLNKGEFKKIVAKFGIPEIDLFASRLNNQVPRYISWQPDPNAEGTDAFHFDWGKFKFYAFPPFCLIGRCIQKIIQDKAKGIIVVPNWPTQPWFPLLYKLVADEPLLIKRYESLMVQPVTLLPHPLHDRIDLLACRVYGHLSR